MHWDVIVIGSGQAGVPLAARLARSGRRVLVAERLVLGGTCVNYGCTPTKTMVASAAAAHAARVAGRLGVRVDGVRVDLGAVVERKDRMVAEWRDSVRRKLDGAGANLRLIRGHARLVAPGAVEIGGQPERHEAPVIVLNTGTRAAAPPIGGLERAPWLDNVRIMELRDVPERLLVVGGGFIGCEFAQMFRRFGARVDVIQSAPHLLDDEDPDVSAALEEALREEGVELRLSARAASVAWDGRSMSLELEDGERLTGSHLLVATGRRPNTGDLGCDAAGVRLDERGYVLVDDFYRTSADGIYAVGDIAGPGAQFTHSAWDDHRILFDHLVGRDGRKRSDRLVPHTVFTDPQVARVGLTEVEAQRSGVRYEKATLPFSKIARARETGRTAGTMKLLLDPDRERVLGASIVGAEAGELIHVLVALMAADAPARAIVDAEMVHPTFAEGLQTLIMRLDRYALD